MTTMQTPFIPPSKVGTQVASSPPASPLHPPSAIYPHTPMGFAHALRGDARPKIGIIPPVGGFTDVHREKKILTTSVSETARQCGTVDLVPMPPFWGGGAFAVGTVPVSLPKKIRGMTL